MKFLHIIFLVSLIVSCDTILNSNYPIEKFENKTNSIIGTESQNLNSFEWIKRINVGRPNLGANFAQQGGDAVYDTERQVIVRFANPETWEYDGNSWKKIQTSQHPNSDIVAMAYDKKRKVTVLVGDGCGKQKNITWEYDGDWLKANPKDPAPRRTSHALAYDSKRNVIVLFGGYGPGCFPDLSTTNETWEYDGITWKQVLAQTSPSPRFLTDMAFDPTLEKIVMHGGFTRSPFGSLSDTWEYNGESWTKFDANLELMSHRMEWIPEIGSVVIFGGAIQFGPPNFQFSRTNKAWYFNNQNWIEISASNNPAPRNSHFMAYDLNRSILVVQGGNIGGKISRETWELPMILEIEIDIKPQSCPNPLNTNSRGVVPLAILGNSDFDVSTLDISSLRLEGVAPIKNNIDDVSTSFKNQLSDCECNSAGPDGFADLILKFNTDEVVKKLGTLNNGDKKILTLTGKKKNGRHIKGMDCIVILKN